ncbi:selenium metabolism-associated LysR family transcriptional regulator [Sediminibacillus massiliensis]|uniref:selenium metabolism-associated LysR family transcriptional regulator n=1 Tax=Sediminibacillus massiliensis TaxID=1926277 RepID=UPI0009883C50|nr:selenium metabolism-associated LysR family transcriptional regulator [Sediminibacillus massiliensis]
MNLKRIQAFVLVVEKGSFSAAAELTGLSQPAISQQIKTLEKDLDVPLLERTSSALRPTPAGNYVYKAGSDLLSQWNEMAEGVRAFHSTLTGILRIGASTIPGTYLAPSWISQFNKSFSKVDMIMDIQDSGNVLSSLIDKKIDIAITSSESASQEVVSEPVAHDSLVLISPIGHPLGNTVYPKDPCNLVSYPFVLREPGSGTLKTMEAGLEQCGLSLSDIQVVAQFGSTESLISAVEHGLGISYVSRLAAAPAVKAGRVQLVSEMKPFSQTYYMSYLRSMKAYPVVREFTSLVLQLVKEIVEREEKDD